MLALSSGARGKRRKLRLESRYAFWRNKMEAVVASPLPPRPVPKEFRPKHPELMILDDYSGSAPPEYWRTFPSNRDEDSEPPFNMKADKFMAIAEELGITDQCPVKEVVADIRYGCDLKINEAKCPPTWSENSPSVAKNGVEVADTLAFWTSDKIVLGPFTEEEVPNDATVIRMATAPKPGSRKIRIIQDMSSPPGRSVNEACDRKEYPTHMGGVKELLRAINHCGRGCFMTKNDWVSAYKHLRVLKRQRKFQWFRFLNRFFIEVCLTFGHVNSPGLYERTAALPVKFTVRTIDFLDFLAIQHLDDVIAINSSDEKAWEFFSCYRKICDDLGISLAGLEDPDKAFAPCQRGLCLGIIFDTVSWRWSLAEEKIFRYVNDVEELLQKDTATIREAQSVNGKLIYMMDLVPGGRYRVSHLMKLATSSEDMWRRVTITEDIRRDLRWWTRVIILTKEGMPIPPHRGFVTPPWCAVRGDTDAAGGSLSTPGRGLGAICDGAWAVLRWPAIINGDSVAQCCGNRWRFKLTFLEIIGHLLHLVAFPDKVRNKSLVTYIDNAGSCAVWRKGYDLHCGTTDTILRACDFVAVAMYLSLIHI